MGCFKTLNPNQSLLGLPQHILMDFLISAYYRQMSASCYKNVSYIVYLRNPIYS